MADSWWTSCNRRGQEADFYKHAHDLAVSTTDTTVYLGPEQRTVNIEQCPPSWECDYHEPEMTTTWPKARKVKGGSPRKPSQD